MAKEFLKEVEKLEDDVFKPEGLPSLLTKDNIRNVNLKLRFF
jgi:hypothetical protein